MEKKFSSSAAYKRRHSGGDVADKIFKEDDFQVPNTYTPGYKSSVLLDDDDDDDNNNHLNLDMNLNSSNRFATSGRLALFSGNTMNSMNASNNHLNMNETRGSMMFSQDPFADNGNNKKEVGRSESFSNTFANSLDDFDTSNAGLARMFEALDLDHDNVLSYDEICRVVEYLSIQKNLSTRQIQLLMNSFDQFESITLEAFKQIIISFMVSVYQSQQQEIEGDNYQHGFEEIIAVDYYPNDNTRPPVFMYVEKGSDPLGNSGHRRNHKESKKQDNSSSSKVESGAWFTPRSFCGNTTKDISDKKDDSKYLNQSDYQSMDDSDPSQYTNIVRGPSTILKRQPSNTSRNSDKSSLFQEREATGKNAFHDEEKLDLSSRLNKEFFKSISFADLLAQPTFSTESESKDRVRWISIIGVDPAIILLLANKYSIHHLVVEDILGAKNERSKMDAMRGIVHILLPFIFVETCSYAENNGRTDKNDVDTSKRKIFGKLSSLRGKENKLKFNYGSKSQPELVKEKCHIIYIKEANTVIYITKEKTKITDLILSRMTLPSSKIRLNNVEFLIYSMIDALLDQTYDSMEFLMKQIRELKDDHKHIISKFSQLHAMAHLTREIEVLGMWIKPLQPVVLNVSNRFLKSASLRSDQNRHLSETKFSSGLLSRDGGKIDDGGYITQEDPNEEEDELRQHYSDLLDNTISLWDECQMVVQWANSVNEEFKTFNEFRTNRILYILTIMGSLVIPCQTLAAIYGMNFTSPDFQYLLNMESGFNNFWFESFAISFIMLFSFKAAGWI